MVKRRSRAVKVCKGSTRLQALSSQQNLERWEMKADRLDLEPWSLELRAWSLFLQIFTAVLAGEVLDE
jgi:hypothetical protein